MGHRGSWRPALLWHCWGRGCHPRGAEVGAGAVGWAGTDGVIGALMAPTGCKVWVKSFIP